MLSEIFKFIRQKYTKPVLVWLCLLFIILVYFSFNIFFQEHELNKTWSSVIDPSLTIFGVFSPLLLGLLLIYNEWKASLENKLIVHFSLKKGDSREYVMSCYNINLLENGDMRAIGQQIGGQMGDSRELKFNPSIKPLKEEVIEILDAQGNKKWVKYYEIEFLLDSEPINKDNKATLLNTYLVWNLFDEKKLEKKLKYRPCKPFDEVYKNEINIKGLLSFDSNSKNLFEKIKSESIVDNNVIYLLNSPILTTFGTFHYEKIEIENAIEMVKDDKNKDKIVSAIGHEPTASFLSQILETAIAQNRIQIEMQKGDIALIFKIKTRLEENKILTKAELEQTEYELGILKRVK